MITTDLNLFYILETVGNKTEYIIALNYNLAHEVGLELIGLTYS